MTSPQPLTVVQWATGNIGRHALRSVIEDPHLRLVGVLVHSADKAGRDAGDLCGLGPVGVPATRSLDDIVALGADCVLAMPQGCDFDVFSALLASGSNVVTTRGEFHHPPSLEPRRREQIEAACHQGSSSIHSTGSSPGFISEAVPMVLASLQRRLDELIIDEFADLSKRNSPELLFNLMGFGADPESFDQGRWAHGAQSFGPSLRMLCEALALPLDSVTASGDVACARLPTEIAAGTIAAGTVAAQRMTVSGIRDGRPLVQFRATWFCTDDLDPPWQLGATGWRLTVVGDAPLDVSISFAVPIEKMGAMSPAFTANRAVNAIRPLCAAGPGIRTTLDLPHILPALS